MSISFVFCNQNINWVSVKAGGTGGNSDQIQNWAKRHLHSLKMIHLQCQLRLPPAFTDTHINFSSYSNPHLVVTAFTRPSRKDKKRKTNLIDTIYTHLLRSVNSPARNHTQQREGHTKTKQIILVCVHCYSLCNINRTSLYCKLLS